MTTPVRLRLSRTADFNLQALSRATNGLPAINVARPSRYGNPFTESSVSEALRGPWDWCGSGAGRSPLFHLDHSTKSWDRTGYLIEAIAQNVAVDLFEAAVHEARARNARGIIDWLRPLHGHNLACWCRDDEPCHADVLLRLAGKLTCDEVAS